YFGRDELTVPAPWIAVVDLTAPGSPRDPADIRAQFPRRTIAHLPTASSRRAPTTLLLFASPQPVPPLRWGPALRPVGRLPFGYRDSRRRPAPSIDGVLLRADNPRWAADRFVAARSVRGGPRAPRRVGGARAARVGHAARRGPSAARPGAAPPWARPTVDRLDGIARVLAVALLPLA